jgi:primosomal protein N' (replication factor Y)
MIVKVIPLRRMPLKIPWLDYMVPDELKNKIKIGALVAIPIRKQISYGIVAAFGPSQVLKKMSVKEINGIFFDGGPLLSEQIINFINEFSNFYRVSPGFVLKNAFFKLTKKNLGLIADRIKIKLNNKQARAIKKPILFNFETENEKYQRIIELCEHQGQKLILTPTTEQAKEIFLKLSQKINNKIVLITGETSDKQYFENWLEIRNNNKIIAVGTRRAIFLPWIDLQTIIMDDEGNFLHKSWDMAPRFNSHDAILIMSKFTASAIYFFSQTPSVESYFFGKKNIYASEGAITACKNPTPIFLHKRNKNHYKKYQIIDEDIIEAITNSKKNAFIYINKKSSYASVICQDCGNNFQCDNCKRSLNYSKKSNLLTCEFCGIKKELPFTCPKCENANYVFLGAGAESVAAEISAKMSHKKIIIIDKESLCSVSLLNDKEAKIIIGTDYAWLRINWDDINIFAMIDPDFSLILPEYKATEDLWQKIRQAQILLPKNASYFIQTANAEHPVFKGIYEPDYFYAKELTERKKFGYPPFKFLIRLLVGLSTQSASVQEAKNFYNKLKNLTNQCNNVTISNPLKSNPPYFRAKYWHIILVKADYANYKKITSKIAEITDQTWKFDPNPNNILSIS